MKPLVALLPPLPACASAEGRRILTYWNQGHPSPSRRWRLSLVVILVLSRPRSPKSATLQELGRRSSRQQGVLVADLIWATASSRLTAPCSSSQVAFDVVQFRWSVPT